MNTYITAALVLALVGLGLAGLIFLILVPAKLILDRANTRDELKRWTDEYVAEVADVHAQEAALALKAAEADAHAALDEVAALFADPDIALKLALLAEGRAA